MNAEHLSPKRMLDAVTSSITGPPQHPLSESQAHHWHSQESRGSRSRFSTKGDGARRRD